MSTDGDARDVILRRVRSAIAPSAEVDEGRVNAAWREVPRLYTRGGARRQDEVLDLLEDRLRDYDASVERVLRADLPGAISRCLERNGMPRMVVPAGMPAELLRDGWFTEDAGLDHMSLDQFGGVMTLATLAIAVTGTLVLQNTAGQGRRATTLIPDYHLCLVEMASVVETVSEAMAQLQTTASLATTFISGPSATADIEMTRIKGVHGPRVLDVLLIGRAADPL